MAGAAVALALTALANIHHGWLRRYFVADRAAGAAAGIGFTHLLSSFFEASESRAIERDPFVVGDLEVALNHLVDGDIPLGGCALAVGIGEGLSKVFGRQIGDSRRPFPAAAATI